MPSLQRQWKKEQRQFTKFTLTGNTTYDLLTFNAIAYATRKSLEDDDFTHVIKVHFNTDCTYGQFVQLCNMMRTLLQRRYTYDGDDFYIWQMPETQSYNTPGIQPLLFSISTL
jgi:hypothetical protein